MVMLYIVGKHFWWWFWISNLFGQILIFGPGGGVKVRVVQNEFLPTWSCYISMLILNFEFVWPNFNFWALGRGSKWGSAGGRPKWISPNMVMLGPGVKMVASQGSHKLHRQNVSELQQPCLQSEVEHGAMSTLLCYSSPIIWKYTKTLPIYCHTEYKVYNTFLLYLYQDG